MLPLHGVAVIIPIICILRKVSKGNNSYLKITSFARAAPVLIKEQDVYYSCCSIGPFCRYGNRITVQAFQNSDVIGTSVVCGSIM